MRLVNRKSDARLDPVAKVIVKKVKKDSVCLSVFVSVYDLLIFTGVMYNRSLAPCPVVQRCRMRLRETLDGDIETLRSADQLMWDQQHRGN